MSESGRRGSFPQRVQRFCQLVILSGWFSLQLASHVAIQPFQDFRGTRFFPVTQPTASPLPMNSSAVKW